MYLEIEGFYGEKGLRNLKGFADSPTAEGTELNTYYMDKIT